MNKSLITKPGSFEHELFDLLYNRNKDIIDTVEDLIFNVFTPIGSDKPTIRIEVWHEDYLYGDVYEFKHLNMTLCIVKHVDELEALTLPMVKDLKEMVENIIKDINRSKNGKRRKEK